MTTTTAEPPDSDDSSTRDFDVPRDCSRLTRALLAVAGAHNAWIDNRHDATTLSCQGALLLLVSAIAFGGAVGGGWALAPDHHLTGPVLAVVLTVATAWALFVFFVDRWITSSIDHSDLKTPPPSKASLARRKTFFYGSRIVVAVIVGVVISESLTMAAFDTSITAKLAEIHRSDQGDVPTEISERFEEQKNATDQAVTDARTALAEATSIKNGRYDDWQKELRGIGGTGVAGNGDEARRLQRLYDQANVTVADRQNDLNAALGNQANLRRTVDKAIADEAPAANAVVANDDGLPARHAAMVKLALDDWGFLSIWVIITLVLLAMDLTPLLLKLSGPYMVYLENARADAMRRFGGSERNRIENNIDLLDAKQREADRAHQHALGDATRATQLVVATHAADTVADHVSTGIDNYDGTDDPRPRALAEQYLAAGMAHLHSSSRRWHASADHVDYVIPDWYTDSQPASDPATVTVEPDPVTTPPAPRTTVSADPEPVTERITTPHADPPRAAAHDMRRYGLGRGKYFPDNDLLVDNPSDRVWKIDDSEKPWKTTGTATLYEAVDADDDDGKKYVIKAYFEDGGDDNFATSMAIAERDTKYAVSPGHIPGNPNIAHIFFAEEYDGRMVIITELFPNTLDTYQTEQIKQRPHKFTLFHVLDLAEQLLGALATVWTFDDSRDAARVHLDVKPHNIGITADGQLKLFDWGLARRLAGPGVTSTRAGHGTYFYAPPEQASLERLTGEAGNEPLWPKHMVAADVYAWAATVYEMITGAPPHKREAYAHGLTEKSIEDNQRGEATTFHHIQRGPFTPPSAIIPGLPREFDDFFADYLNYDPAHRHVSRGGERNASRRRKNAGETRLQIMARLSRIRAAVLDDGLADLPVGHVDRYLKPAAPPGRMGQQQGPDGQHQWLESDKQAREPHRPAVVRRPGQPTSPTLPPGTPPDPTAPPGDAVTRAPQFLNRGTVPASEAPTLGFGRPDIDDDDDLAPV